MKVHMINSLDGLCQYNKLFYNFYILKFYYNADIIFNCIYFQYILMCLLHSECCTGLLSIS
jgi:hypothetical protein